MSYTASYIVNSSSAQGTTDFQFTFPYIKEEHIEVFLNFSKITQGSGSAQYQVITNVSPKLIRLNTGIASANLRVEVRRNSSLGSPLVDYADGSTLTANDLDTSALQSLYIDQELKDNQGKTVSVDETTGLPTLNNLRLTNVGDPTAAQDAVTKAYLERTGSITSTQILDGTIVNADINSGAAISGSKLQLASGSNPGALSTSDFSKLGNIETAATADQTDAEIRAAVEAANDSNVFTDADHSKLNAIEPSATADQTDAEIRAAVEAATDSNVFTDADHSKLNAIEANATADQTAAEIKSLIATSPLDASHLAANSVGDSEIATGALDNRYYRETELLTDGVLDARYYTESEADARFYNLASGEEIQSGETWSAADNKIATTAAIDARITDLVEEVGGFVPIANETSFPAANPDINNGAGTLVSVKGFASSHTPSGGSVTIANGAGSGNTVTITGCGSTVLAAGFGGIVETTSTLHTYTFHRLTPKATEVTTVAGNISNINAVANNQSNINSAVSNQSNINAVVANATNINTVASNNSNITSVAGSLSGTQSYAVTVTNVGGSNYFFIDSVQAPALNLIKGFTYTFDVSASSNSGHPLRFKDGSGNSYTTGVTTSGTEGQAGATVTLAVASNAPSSLRYYCTAHGNGMGNTIATADSNIGKVAGSITNVNNVAGAISNVNTVGGAIANVNTVATNISGVNDFADRYRVASSAPSSNNDEGDLYFDTTSNELRVYNGSAWQGGVTATGNLAGLGANTFTGTQTFAAGQTFDGRDVSADGTKLDGIEAGATADQTAAEIRTLVENAGDSNVFTDADHTKLNAIEAGATGDQTNAEIRAAVEAASDSNVFTDADHTKLNGIEASATADQTAAEIRTLVESANDSNVFTDADHSKLNGIETGATADQTKADIDALNITNVGTLDDLQVTGVVTLSSELDFTGNGNKYIDFATLANSNDITLRHFNGSSYETAISFTANGGANIAHNNNTRLQTTDAGITVTGAVTATSFSGSGANLTNLPASGLSYAGMLKHF